MEKETLKIVREDFKKRIDVLAINDLDRKELSLLVEHLLDENKYYKNIKALQKERLMTKDRSIVTYFEK